MAKTLSLRMSILPLNQQLQLKTIIYFEFVLELTLGLKLGLELGLGSDLGLG